MCPPVFDLEPLGEMLSNAVLRAGLLTLVALGLASVPEIARAQQRSEAQALEHQAIASAVAGGLGGLRRAARFWSQAAEKYASAGLLPRAAAAWDSSGRMYERLDARDSALAQMGRALAIRDTSITAQVDSLLNSSPLLQPTRSVADEERFVLHVRRLLAIIRGRPTPPDEVPNAEAAVGVLEEFNAGRETLIEVQTIYPTFPFSFRRWLYRRSTADIWDSRAAATRFQAARQTYQFKYVDPRSGRETIITRPCADSPCVVQLPAPLSPRTP
jgi:hypothetical protein